MARTWLAATAAALLVAFAVPISADHPQSFGTVTTTFDHRGGNEWWVEVRVTGGDIYVVHAIESDGNAMELRLNDWGNHVGSMHIEPGHTIRFTANARDGSAARESCWFTHPSGVENCEGVTDDRLAAATYVSMASGGFERTADVAIDAAGNAYVAGSTGPGVWEHHDALIAKYHPDGSLAWRRVIEGNGANLAYSIDLDAAGNIYVGGVTESTDFPATGWQTTNRGLMDGWVAKLSPTGTIQWATLIGGSRNDHVHAIGVDRLGAVTAAGFTNSCDFPTYGPAFQTAPIGCTFVVDGFVTRLTPDGSSAVHSTFYRGFGLGTDIIEDLVSEPDGTVHIVGRTDSADLPMTADAAQPVHGGHTDAFYARFSPLSHLEYATFLGGNQDDRLRGVVLDGTGGAVVSGDSGSLGYPTTAGSVQPQHSGGAQCLRTLASGPNPETEAIPCQDLVVTRINEAGDIAYSTFFGTPRDEEGYGIARDAAGGLHMTGRIYQEGALPGEQNPIGPAGGYSDAFLVSIAADGASTTRSVRIGGTHGDFGEQTAIAPDGSLWLVGWTWSPDAPTTSGAAQRSLDGMEDGYLARLPPPAAPPPSSGFDATFTLVTGNAYWVQSQVTPNSGFTVASVDVRLNGGAWKPLTLQSWGVRAWAASYPIPEGTVVQMRATATTSASDLSECYRWIPPQGGGQTAATIACGSAPPPPPPPPPSGTFDATFTGVRGNEYWVQAGVTATGGTIAKVDIRINSGVPQPLTKQSWGGWANSYRIMQGSVVEFRATSTTGVIDSSDSCYQWIPASGKDATAVSCESPPPPPPPSTGFDATFTGVKGNEWWEQASVSATGGTLANVDVSLNGGTWQALAKQSWGGYAASYRVVDGTIVQLRATSATGATDLSDCYRWIPTANQDAAKVTCGSPPPPLTTADVAFGLKAGNEWWVETLVVGDGETILTVEGRAGLGAWHALTYREWGAWAGSFHVSPGSDVQLRATTPTGTDTSVRFTWPDAKPVGSDGSWPEEGSYARYDSFYQVAPGQNDDTFTDYVYHDGAWWFHRYGEHEDPGLTSAIKEWGRSGPAFGPTDPAPGQFATSTFDTHQEGDPVTVTVWQDERIADCKCDNDYWEWETATGIYVWKYNSGTTYSTHRLLDTNAPMQTA